MSLIPVLLHIFAENTRQATDIKVGIMSMHPYERTVETFAKPVTHLRLYAPVTQAAAIIRFPRVIVDRYIQCPFTGVTLGSEEPAPAIEIPKGETNLYA